MLAMKTAALLLFPILTLAAEPLVRNLEETQAIFDAAVSSADKMVISVVSIVGATKSNEGTEYYRRRLPLNSVEFTKK